MRVVAVEVVTWSTHAPGTALPRQQIDGWRKKTAVSGCPYRGWEWAAQGSNL